MAEKALDARPITEEADFLQIKAIDHLHFWVGNAKHAMHFWWKAFGFKPVAYSGLETGNRRFASYVLESGKIRFVVSAPYGPSDEMAALTASLAQRAVSSSTSAPPLGGERVTDASIRSLPMFTITLPST